MPFDAPMAEPAPTRRSSRLSPTPLQASSETLGASRAQLRRRAASPDERVTVVLDASAPVGPMADESSFSGAAPAPAAIDIPATGVPLIDAVAAATPLIAASVSPAAPSAGASAVANVSSAPLSRRARRAVTIEQPAVVPPIAPVAPADAERAAAEFAADLPTAEAPAPLMDAVLAPAEPFELLEPVIDEPAPAEASDASAEHVEVLEVVAETPATRPTRRQRVRRVSSETDAAPVAVDAVGAVTVEDVVADAEDCDEPTPRAEQAANAVRAEDQASGIDEFEAAARLFSFTGEVSVQTSAEDAGPEAGDAPTTAQAAAHIAPRKTRAERGASFKRFAAASFSVGVMGIVGVMTVGMTTPAEAVAAAGGADVAMSIVAPGSTTITEVDADEIQAYVAPAEAEADTLDRAGAYDTVTTAELASQAGIQNFSNLFHNDPNSAIQWPFAVGVTMSYGFGMRSGRMHEGIDFTPGAGSPIQSIADGTVRVASEAGGAYGVHVIIDHMVDGQLVSSHYAHMQYGSLEVVPGQKVTVGTVLGKTGNTGRSYGAHTHFEILMNGTTPIDPMPWLREHAGG